MNEEHSHKDAWCAVRADIQCCKRELQNHPSYIKCSLCVDTPQLALGTQDLNLRIFTMFVRSRSERSGWSHTNYTTGFSRSSRFWRWPDHLERTRTQFPTPNLTLPSPSPYLAIPRYWDYVAGARDVDSLICLDLPILSSPRSSKSVENSASYSHFCVFTLIFISYPLPAFDMCFPCPGLVVPDLPTILLA